jgi:hypothetical protein
VGASVPGASAYRVLEVDELGLGAAAIGAFIEQHWARKVAL